MSTTLAPPVPPTPSVPTIKLLTIADVAVFPRSLPSGDVRYELDDGRLIVMPPPGDIHGAAQSKFGAALVIQGDSRGLGKARTEVGLVLRRNPDRLVCPDALFVAAASLPIRRSSEGYLETIPDLVVEIRSPNDTGPEVQAKVDEYLAAGVRVVWVADPDRQTVMAHRTGQPLEVFGPADALTVPDVIPGFQIPVADLFRD
ncbi:MAG TPA: Uma2 family endonuclease [Gemmataceae bacterium]|nr:Uma2 family endonuclease [Gemmataceae bacterium]